MSRVTARLTYQRDRDHGRRQYRDDSQCRDEAGARGTRDVEAPQQADAGDDGDRRDHGRGGQQWKQNRLGRGPMPRDQGKQEGR